MTTTADFSLETATLSTVTGTVTDGGGHGWPLYARIDMIPGPDGEPRIMELELIEPSLFFDHSPESLDRFAGAIARRPR